MIVASVKDAKAAHCRMCGTEINESPYWSLAKSIGLHKTGCPDAWIVLEGFPCTQGCAQTRTGKHKTCCYGCGRIRYTTIHPDSWLCRHCTT